MSVMNEKISEAIDDQLHNIKFNLCQLFGGLLYSVKLEMEKEGIVCGIDDLIRIVVDTSGDSGHEDSYPIWAIDNRSPYGQDKTDKEQAQKIISAMAKILQSHGITQHCGFFDN